MVRAMVIATAMMISVSVIAAPVTAMLLAGATSAQQAKPPVPVDLPDDLTPREAEVLKLLAAGLSNGETARALGFGPWSTADGVRSRQVGPLHTG
jgi:DNA-binding NarL/FixJ family response regulator